MSRSQPTFFFHFKCHKERILEQIKNNNYNSVHGEEEMPQI